MKKIIYAVCLILLVVFLVWASRNEVWKYHLAFDISTFFARYQTFIKTNSFIGFGSNEYLPFSLFLFIFPGLFSKTLNWDAYFNFFTVINLLLLLGHLFLYRRINRKGNIFLPLALFAAIGPILLFRFELLVSFLFLLSIYLFVKAKYGLSAFVLGLSVATKLYPVFVLPYFLLILFKNGKIKETAKYFLIVLLGVGVPMIIYLLLGGQAGDLIKNLAFHVDKPIGLESLVASFIAIPVFLRTHILPGLINAHGVWGFPDTESLAVSLLPYISMGVIYLEFLLNAKKKVEFNAGYAFLIIAIFLLTSKYLNPQYMIWIFGLLPLFEFNKSWVDRTLIIGGVLILAATQLTYPVFFTQLLDSFGHSNPGFVYWLLQARNLLFLIEVALIWIYRLA